MALPKIVLDTCVLESAVRSNAGAGYQILQRVPLRKFRFGISVALFAEYESRLTWNQAQGLTRVSPGAIQTILTALAYYGDEVSIYYRLRPNLKDENDNLVFECCAHYQADYLVTYNTKDFRRPELRGYGFAVITPQHFLTEVLR